MSGTAHALKASSLEVHSSASKEVSKSHMTVEAQEHVDVCQDFSDILANYRRAAVDINFSLSGASYPAYTRFCVVDYTYRAHITPQAQMPSRFVVSRTTYQCASGLSTSTDLVALSVPRPNPHIQF